MADGLDVDLGGVIEVLVFSLVNGVTSDSVIETRILDAAAVFVAVLGTVVNREYRFGGEGSRDGQVDRAVCHASLFAGALELFGEQKLILKRKGNAGEIGPSK